MRALSGLVAVLGLVATLSTADARTTDDQDPPAKHRAEHRDKRAKPERATTTKRHASKTRARRISASAVRGHDRIELRGLATGQSVGAPWEGRLQHASQLAPGEGYFIRHPQRTFGTETTVALIERAIGETLDDMPDVHVLAIGDISAEYGGQISDHRSHQSGRDADIGLFYKEQPDGYPAGFIHANLDNLDCAATFKLLERFLATAGDDGGVLMIFLDYDVQGILYHWALDNGVSPRRLDRIFQYPHGRGSAEGIVRHEPNHDNHMHVRFQCASEDTACQ